jgi:hypothetical protein
MSPTRTSWSDLPLPAKAFRLAHTAWAVVSMAALGDIWLAVMTGRRDRRVAASIAWLSLEGIALVRGRGDCPFGPLQTSLGDPVPLFELALPPRAAKAAVPMLGAIAATGIGLVALREGRRLVARRLGRATDGVLGDLASHSRTPQRDSHQVSNAS